jgi:hypothetical protein
MNTKIEMFFRDPNEEPETSGEFGTLYLLRRDINQCFNNSIIWPATMCILAGFDLLGKFYAGNDRSGCVGERFRNFVNNFVLENQDQTESKVLYYLRNSMLHSFGLYANRHHIVLDQNETAFISKNEDTYTISTFFLRRMFESGIEKFRRALAPGNDEAIARFDSMFGRYGSIRIG